MKNRIGEIKESNKCGLMKIIEYNNYSNIKVKFKTGSITKTNYGNYKKGNVKDPLFPSAYKIGYVGVGKFKTKINHTQTTEYITWKNMIYRCYDPYFINKYPTYRNAIVCKKWLNFQNFSEWHQKNHYEIFGERIDLDKDLIKIGNKSYCPKFCSFIPQSINKLLLKKDKFRGIYTIGVSFNESVNKFSSTLCVNGKQNHLGYFSNSISAFNVYKKAKEKQIKLMTNKYKNILNVEVYKSLLRYEILITD